MWSCRQVMNSIDTKFCLLVQKPRGNRAIIPMAETRRHCRGLRNVLRTVCVYINENSLKNFFNFRTILVHSNKNKTVYKFWTFSPVAMHSVRHVLSSVTEKPRESIHRAAPTKGCLAPGRQKLRGGNFFYV